MSDGTAYSDFAVKSTPGYRTMTVVTIRLAGEPNGKGRPRISTRNNMVRAYTPEKSRNYSAALRMAAAAAMGDRPLFDGPVVVVVSASFAIPVSMSKGKRLSAL